MVAAKTVAARSARGRSASRGIPASFSTTCRSCSTARVARARSETRARPTLGCPMFGRGRTSRTAPRAIPREEYQYTEGREKPLDPDVADVLLNAFLIFGFVGAPWLLEPSHFTLWLPLAVGTIALVPRVRGAAHQIVDVFRRRLQRAWNGGRERAASDYSRRYQNNPHTSSSYANPSRSYTSGGGGEDPVSRDARKGGREPVDGEENDGAGPRREEGQSSSGGMVHYPRESYLSRGMGRPRGRTEERKEAPLVLRMLFSLFPFMRFWGGFL